MAQWTRYLRPGVRVIEVDDDDTVVFFDDRNRSVVIIAVNNTADERTVGYDFDRFLPAAVTIAAVRTSANEDLVTLPSSLLEANRFTATFKPGSVTTFLLEGLTPR